MKEVSDKLAQMEGNFGFEQNMHRFEILLSRMTELERKSGESNVLWKH